MLLLAIFGVLQELKSRKNSIIIWQNFKKYLFWPLHILNWLILHFMPKYMSFVNNSVLIQVILLNLSIVHWSKTNKKIYYFFFCMIWDHVIASWHFWFCEALKNIKKKQLYTLYYARLITRSQKFSGKCNVYILTDSYAKVATLKEWVYNVKVNWESKKYNCSC